jgi:outer membrane protein
MMPSSPQHPRKPGSGPFVRRALLCLGLCCSSAVYAQDSERSWNLGLALGHGERSNPLISGESIDINAVVDFSWYGERFFFDNGDFGFLLNEQRRYSVNLIATVNNERNFYNYLTGSTFGLRNLVDISRNFGPAGAPIDGEPGQGFTTENTGQGFLETVGLPKDTSTVFVNQNTELADRDAAINGGIEFLYISPWGDIQAQLVSDVSSTHDGQEAWLSWSHPWYTHSNEFTLTLGAEWKSSKLVSYYYGVRADESFPGRDPYASGSGTNTFVRFAARHALSEHWQLAGMVEREFLSSAISNSPIVDATYVDTFFAGLFYQF